MENAHSLTAWLASFLVLVVTLGAYLIMWRLPWFSGLRRDIDQRLSEAVRIIVTTNPASVDQFRRDNMRLANILLLIDTRTRLDHWAHRFMEFGVFFLVAVLVLLWGAFAMPGTEVSSTGAAQNVEGPIVAWLAHPAVIPVLEVLYIAFLFPVLLDIVADVWRYRSNV